MLIVRTAVVGPFAANTYLLGCSKTEEAVLVDPGGDVEDGAIVFFRLPFAVGSDKRDRQHAAAPSSCCTPIVVCRDLGGSGRLGAAG